MTSLIRRAALLASTVLVVAGLLASCSPAPSLDASHATVIDVRTPAEYATGHLQGAINIDVQAPDFATKIAAQPKGGKYILYCRTGVRAGTALNLMKAAGFTDVTSAGGMTDASKATGLPIVT